MSYTFYSKEVLVADWTHDVANSEYFLIIPQSEHNQEGSLVVSSFESTVDSGLRSVVGDSEVSDTNDVTVKFELPMNGRIVIRGK